MIREQRTQPVTKLFDPSWSRVIYWWVQDNNLILYPNLMNDGFYSLHELERKAQGNRTMKEGSEPTFSYFILLSPLLLFMRSLNGASLRITASSSIRSPGLSV